MKTNRLIQCLACMLLLCSAAFNSLAQIFVDCSCLATQAVLTTSGCQAVIPDMCQFTNCFQSTVVPPPPFTCSQSPAPGTPVGPGSYGITVTISVPGAAPQFCTLVFTVNAPSTGCGLSLNCATNKTVECGTTWSFDPPTPVNPCPDPVGGPGNVTITILSTVTNGTCPEIIKRTWQAVDDCGAIATCMQTITVVDTTPPFVNCNCLRDFGLALLRTNACSGIVPDLCKFTACYGDTCNRPTCTQLPAAGTVVGPGVHPITITITDCAGNSVSCAVPFQVVGLTQKQVWNSGMGGANGTILLPAGAADTNFTLVSQPPGGCTGPVQVLDTNTIPAPPWVGTGPNSQWIGAGPTAYCQEGVYHYRLCFYLPCTDGASILGQWAADDGGEILLNGQPVGQTIPSPQYPNIPLYSWFPIKLTNGFVCGQNCLDFYVTNASIGINPTGFRAELTNVFNECCCQPAQTLFNIFSGQNSAGPLAGGSPDNQFTLTCKPASVNVTTPVVIYPSWIPSPWVPDGPNSQWIGPDPTSYAPAGVYCYSLRFRIPCPPGVPIKASLTGRWSADDTGHIELNGQPVSTNLPPGWAFTNWHGINITSGFVSGLNTLTFYVTNWGGPTGLRLELTGSASCCACVTTTNCSCTFTNGDFAQFVPDNATGGGWTSSGLFPGSAWQSSGGNPGECFLLNEVGDPASDPTISQTLCCLTPGQCYTIRGQRKVQAWYGQTAPSFAVLLDGVTILALPVPSNPADANWYGFAVSFTATKPCHTISFASEINGTDVSYWIDNIRLDCCSQTPTSCIACPPLNMTVTGCPPLMPDFSTNSFSGPGCTPVGPLIVSQSIPPGTPLPGGQTVVIVHVCDAVGNCRDCDVIINAVSTGGNPVIKCPNDRVLLTCSNSAIAYFTATATGNTGPVVCTPPSGSAFPVNSTTYVTCFATNNCGGKASCYFAITVKPQHPHWFCNWMALGFAATPLGQAQLTARPNLGSSGQDGVSIDNLGSSGQDGVRLAFGPAQKITFSTVLDFTAPEGATLEFALPPNPVDPSPTPLLSFHRKSGPKGYCVKTAKFVDDATAQYRGIAVGTNGDLGPSLTQSANLDSYVPLNIFNQPGVTSVLMTVTLDCTTHEVTLAFPDCVWTNDNARKGWDGCIYGNSPPGHKKSAAFVLTPVTVTVLPPITTLDLRAASMPEIFFDDPSITTAGRKWGDGHVTLMKAYDDGEQGMEFTSFGNGGGVHVDLGHTESFNLRLQKFQDGDIPTQDDLVTRTIGPIRGLTNRPPPPFLDAMLLHGTSEGVECSADFSNIGSLTTHVLVYNHGVLVAERAGVWSQLGDPLLVLPEWPNTLGKLGGRVSCRSGTVKLGSIRLPGGGGGIGLFAPAATLDQIVIGDEFRILAELPDDAPRPDYYSAFEFLPSDGPTWQVSGVQRTVVCPATGITIMPGAAGLLITWPGENFHLQGSEHVNGPWLDLGVESPVSLLPGHPARFFRLLCD